MHSKVTIVVDSLHWCCCSCQIVNKHGDSIDEHLKSFHINLLSATSGASSCDPQLRDFTEGEFDLHSQPNKKATKEEHLETALVPVQRKCVRLKRSKHAENPDSQMNSKTNFLSSKSSGDIPETKSVQDMVSPHLRKNIRSSNRLSSNQKCSELGMKKEQAEEERGSPGKRRRLQSTPCCKDRHEECRPTTCDNQFEAKDTESSEANMELSCGKSCSDIKDYAPDRTRRDRPKGSIKQKDTVRKKLKTVDRESKKYCWGGKPVKRSLEITEQEMKKLKMGYVGNEQSTNCSDAVLTAPLVLEEDKTGAKKSSHTVLDDRESLSDTTLETIELVQTTPTQSSAVYTNIDQQYANGDKQKCDGSDSGELESNPQGPVSDLTQFTRGGTNAYTINGKIAGMTVAENTSNRNSTKPLSFKAHQAKAHSLHDDSQQSYVCLPKENETFSTLSSIAQESSHTSTECMVASGDVASSVVGSEQVPFSLGRTNAFRGDDILKNASQTDSIGSQHSTTKVMDIVESEKCSVEEHHKDAESEEWIKSRTQFSFSKTKKASNFEQPSRIHECRVCQAKFSSDQFLSDHIVKMSAFVPLKCQNCYHSFHNLYDLNFHAFEDHERRSKPFCFNCGEKFENMASFEKHLYRHKHDHDPKLLDMEYHSCNICQTDVPCRYETLRKHYLNKHKRTICSECFVRSELVLLPDATSVREHKQIHSNFCSICLQDFPSVETLNDHHPCSSEYQCKEDGQGKLCERCNQWCPNKPMATLHHKEHKLQVMRKWRVEKWAAGLACVHCDKILRNKRNLDRHIAQLHSGCRSYNFHCEFCGKGVDSKTILKDHIAVHHLGIKRYSCEYCDQRFVCAPTLRRHILKEHATDRQYACEVCGEKFCEKFKLTRHMYIHTGSARFMCEQCGKGCHSSSDFKKHLAAHEEKRNFACQVCGQEYKRKEHLKRHIVKCTKTAHSNGQVDVPQV